MLSLYLSWARQADNKPGGFRRHHEFVAPRFHLRPLCTNNLERGWNRWSFPSFSQFTSRRRTRRDDGGERRIKDETPKLKASQAISVPTRPRPHRRKSSGFASGEWCLVALDYSPSPSLAAHVSL